MEVIDKSEVMDRLESEIKAKGFVFDEDGGRSYHRGDDRVKIKKSGIDSIIEVRVNKEYKKVSLMPTGDIELQEFESLIDWINKYSSQD